MSNIVALSGGKHRRAEGGQMSPELRKDIVWALNYHREELEKQKDQKSAAAYQSGAYLSATMLCDYHTGAIDALEALVAKYPATKRTPA